MSLSDDDDIVFPATTEPSRNRGRNYSSNKGNSAIFLNNVNDDLKWTVESRDGGEMIDSPGPSPNNEENDITVQDGGVKARDGDQLWIFVGGQEAGRINAGDCQYVRGGLCLSMGEAQEEV